MEAHRSMGAVANNVFGVEVGSNTVTVILRNIACKFTQECVKDVLDECGLRGKFSLVYVPRVEVRQCNLGYAFVCFRTPEYAEDCFKLLHGRVFGNSRTSKVCQVELADTQGGTDALLNRRRRKQNGKAPTVLRCNDPIPVMAAPTTKYTSDFLAPMGQQDQPMLTARMMMHEPVEVHARTAYMTLPGGAAKVFAPTAARHTSMAGRFENDGCEFPHGFATMRSPPQLSQTHMDKLGTQFGTAALCATWHTPAHDTSAPRVLWRISL